MNKYAYLRYILKKQSIWISNSIHFMGLKEDGFIFHLLSFIIETPLRLGKAETKPSLTTIFIEDIYEFRKGLPLQFKFLTKENTE